MRAAALRPPQRAEGLQKIYMPRDLYQIAELVEVCFASTLDRGGRAAISEMKTVARLLPLTWLLALLDQLGAGITLGYVWREDRRVVGNVSLYRAGRHPSYGRGWLIANVAVHPGYRRRGIARALMQAALADIQRRRGQWAALQVEADNEGAVKLYRDLGFQPQETLAIWQAERITPPAWAGRLPVHLRSFDEIPQEARLIFERARPGGMAWSAVINPAEITNPSMGLGGGGAEHWLLPAPDAPDRLLGALWIHAVTRRRARLSLFLDPAVTDPDLRRALLLHALTLRSVRERQLQVETYADDPPVDNLLRASGLRKTRTLLQMRLPLA